MDAPQSLDGDIREVLELITVLGPRGSVVTACATGTAVDRSFSRSIVGTSAPACMGMVASALHRSKSDGAPGGSRAGGGDVSVRANA